MVATLGFNTARMHELAPLGFEVRGQVPVGAVETERPGRLWLSSTLDAAGHAELAWPFTDDPGVRDRYAAGWDAIREARYQRQLELGVLEEGTELAPRNTEQANEVPPWDELPPERRERMLHWADRWLAMTPEEREAARARLDEWRDMRPEHREHLRDRLDDFRDLSPEEQERIREQFREFRDMRRERREELRERWEAMTPEEREAVRTRMRQQRVPPDDDPLLPPRE